MTSEQTRRIGTELWRAWEDVSGSTLVPLGGWVSEMCRYHHQVSRAKKKWGGRPQFIFKFSLNKYSIFSQNVYYFWCVGNRRHYGWFTKGVEHAHFVKWILHLDQWMRWSCADLNHPIMGELKTCLALLPYYWVFFAYWTFSVPLVNQRHCIGQMWWLFLVNLMRAEEWLGPGSSSDGVKDCMWWSFLQIWLLL